MKLIFFFLTNVFAFNINIINSPFDRGANIKGSSDAFKVLEPNLSISNLNINKIENIESDKRHIRLVYNDIYMHSWRNLNEDKLSLQIGGDHSIAIPSIYAANTFCGFNKEKLGVLWIDAHADFNTIQSSPSGNLHGVPIAVLCGHTLPFLSFGEPLDTEQFALYGVRDMDSLELNRIQDHNMLIVDSFQEIKEWMSYYDKIHISFDMDCLDPSIFSSVNTPVDNGLKLEDLYPIFNEIKNNNKLISVDLVEYNPLQGINNMVIIEILENMLL
mgnify:CR=1 FL=1